MLIVVTARFQLEACSQEVLEGCFITMLPAHHNVKCCRRSRALHEVDECWNQLRITIAGYLHEQAGWKIHLRITRVDWARKCER
ncbi:hypothetical protein D3C71_2024010 [compost metagenome]